jgi:hypothetical protein
MRRVLAVTAGLALATAAAPLTPAGAATDGRAFQHGANHACALTGQKVKHLPKVDDKNIATVLGREADLVTELVGTLRKLNAPKAKRAKWTSFLTVTQRQATLVNRAIAAAKKGDAETAATHLEGVVKAGDQADTLAKDLGLSACAGSYTPGVA